MRSTRPRGQTLVVAGAAAGAAEVEDAEVEDVGGAEAEQLAIPPSHSSSVDDRGPRATFIRMKNMLHTVSGTMLA
jgi:hypothetical protein